MKMTVTEALAEIKLIEKKIAKKSETVNANLSRFEHMPDPFEKDGGSKKVLSAEVQSISDLMKRHEKIRFQIAKSNLENNVQVGEETKSIYEWITWKREIFPKHKNIVDSCTRNLKAAIDNQNNRPQIAKNADTGEIHLAKLITNLEYADLLKVLEKMNDTHDQLDGKLSLKNATILIEI